MGFGKTILGWCWCNTATVSMQLFNLIKKACVEKAKGLKLIASSNVADSFPDIADNDINIKFDDSVFEDKETERPQCSWVDVSC